MSSLQQLKNEFCPTGTGCPPIDAGDQSFTNVGPRPIAEMYSARQITKWAGTKKTAEIRANKAYAKNLAFGPHCFPTKYRRSNGKMKSNNKFVRNACHIGLDTERCIPHTHVVKKRGNYEVHMGSFENEEFDSTGLGCTPESPCLLSKAWLKKNKAIKKKLANVLKGVVCPDFDRILEEAQARKAGGDVEADFTGEAACPAQQKAADEVMRFTAKLQKLQKKLALV